METIYIQMRLSLYIGAAKYQLGACKMLGAANFCEKTVEEVIRR
jgi:hypothetical protein